jgi:hypothetical protein
MAELEGENRRQAIRGLLSELFSDISQLPIVPIGGKSPRGNYITIDLGAFPRKGIDQSAEDGEPTGDVMSGRAEFYITAHVSVSADTTSSGKLDQALDNAVELVNLAAAVYEGGDYYTGEGYSMLVDEIILENELPSPDDKNNRGRVLIPGYVRVTITKD